MKQNTLGAAERRWVKEDFEQSAIVPLDPSEVKVQKILVAVDFSEGSRRAVRCAASLARGMTAEIVLVHVFEGVPGELKVLEAAFVPTSFRREAEVNLAEWNRKLASQGIVVTTVFRDGAAISKEIIQAAKESGADLIVLGREGRKLLDKMFPTATVRRVLTSAPCPVLVV